MEEKLGSIIKAEKNLYV